MKNNKKPIFIIISILLVLFISGGIVYYNIAPYYRKIYSAKMWFNVEETNGEKVLLNFVNNKLSSQDGGVYTNYINESSDGDITKGHAVLSESQGIMLLYDLEKNNRDNFDITLDYIKNNMFEDIE